MKLSFNKTLTVVLSLLALTFSAIGPTSAHAAVGPRFAKPGGVTTGGCDSWGNACDLQRALTSALEISVSAVWVMEGTYTPTNRTDRTATFMLVPGVSIYGGFAGTETSLSQRNPATHVTILSGEIGAAGNSDNSYHVVTGANGATLDGFTVTAGNANGSSPNDSGGGIYNSTGTLTVSNSTFSGNGASYGGGGIANFGTLTVSNSIFSSNSGSLGGGILSGGTSDITNSSLSGNSANKGGGIYNNSTLTLSNSTFSGNSAHDGGGIYNDDLTLTIPNYGTLTLSNISFSGNVATLGYGGGLFMNGGSAANIANSTFSGNDGGYYSTAGGIYNAYSRPVTLRNTIVANSTSGANCFGTITNGGNNIDDGSSCGWGADSGSMSSTDPLLGTLANNGGPTQTFALRAGSPAIDGVTSTPPNGAPTTDQRGVARPQGTRYDIGSYELFTPTKVNLPWLLLLLGD